MRNPHGGLSFMPTPHQHLPETPGPPSSKGCSATQALPGHSALVKNLRNVDPSSSMCEAQFKSTCQHVFYRCQNNKCLEIPWLVPNSCQATSMAWSSLCSVSLLSSVVVVCFLILSPCLTNTPYLTLHLHVVYQNTASACNLKKCIKDLVSSASGISPNISRGSYNSYPICNEENIHKSLVPPVFIK